MQFVCHESQSSQWSVQEQKLPISDKRVDLQQLHNLER